MKAGGLLGLRAYALHRKRLGFPGGQLSTVQAAIAQGRIARTCSVHDRCPVDCNRGGIDPERADKDWARFTLEARLPKPAPPPEPVKPNAPSYATARATHELIRARLARLELDRRTGELVPKVEVQMAAFQLARRLRDRLLTIPGAVSGRLLVCEEAIEIQSILTEEIKTALVEVSDWEQGSTPSSPVPSLD